MLAELVDLPDDAAPLRWLMAERGRVAALIALRRVLHTVGGSAAGLRRNVARGWAGAGEGGYVRLLARVEPLVRLADDPAPGADRLREALEAVRAQVPPPPADAEESQLLGELLRAPAGTDPLRWLAAERGEVAARIALRVVLQASRPPALRPLGRHLARRRLRQEIRLPNGPRVAVEELVLGADGFALTAQIRFAWKPLPDGGGSLLPSWAGFDRVVDDVGNHYLVEQADQRAGTYLRWWYRQRLRVVCYPAVAAAATTLTFSALPATLTFLRSRPAAPPLPLPDEPLGDVTWRIAIPRHAGTANRAG